MNLVLIGYRGTGKSTVAKLLAERLHRRVVSMDADIVARAGASIPELVEQHGWEHFRNLESELCRELSARDGLIIDAGGGVILRAQNVEAFKATGVVVWLTAEVTTIVRRIGGDTQRPSLTGTKSFIEEIEEVLRERLPKYRAAADHVVPTDGRTPQEVADAILARVEIAPGC